MQMMHCKKCGKEVKVLHEYTDGKEFVVEPKKQRRMVKVGEVIPRGKEKPEARHGLRNILVIHHCGEEELDEQQGG